MITPLSKLFKFKAFKSYSVVELKDDNEAFDCEILALASPANQTEEIEKNYFQPFMKRNAETKEKLSNMAKKIAAM